MKQLNVKKLTCPLCSSRQIKLMDKNKYNLYFCSFCKNGFVNPQPKNIDEFYPKIYWQNLGKFSSLRQGLHNSFQKTRVRWFRKYISKGNILDVGSGEGMFGKMLGQNFNVTNLEFPGAKVKNKNIVKVDFLTWKTKKRFDAIVFLESLEHVINPSLYLKKTTSLLKKDGLIFVEYPRFDSIESRVLGKYWLQRDIPRHLFHFTEKGLKNMAERTNLKVITQTEIMSFQYSPYCLLASLQQLVGLPILNLRLGIIKNTPTLLFLLIGTPLAFFLEFILYIIGQAPIGVIIFKKK